MCAEQSIDEFRKGDHTIKIFYDEDLQDPREHDCNWSTLIFFHRRRNIGDKHDYKSSDYSGWEEMRAQIIEDFKPRMIVPVFAYEHGNIVFSLGDPKDAFDSGQVGWAVVTEEQVHNAMGEEAVDDAFILRALTTELEEYTDYCNGSGFTYSSSKDDDEDGDSVGHGSYLGYDHERSGLLYDAFGSLEGVEQKVGSKWIPYSPKEKAA